MRLIDTLQECDLEGEAKEISDLIGFENFKKLVETYGGNELYIPKADTLTKDTRNEKIKEEYNGENTFELSQKWGLSATTIRRIVKEKRQEIRTAPLDGQCKLF